MEQKLINTFDFDGVCFMNTHIPFGVRPGLNSVVVTGRSFEEEEVTRKQLKLLGIDEHIPIYFNPVPFDKKTRETSGLHKGNIIHWLKSLGYEHGFHFEDDEIQIQEILKVVPDCRIVHMKHEFTNKENVRHE